MQNGICPKCNSDVIIKDQPVTEHSHNNFRFDLSIEIPGKRGVGLFPSLPAADRCQIRAWICGQCGYTELYTTNFKALLAVDRKRQNDSA